MSKSVGEMTVQQLMQIYPNGFMVSAGGTIEEVLAASSHLYIIANKYPLPPSNGGYVVVQSGERHQQFLEK